MFQTHQAAQGRNPSVLHMSILIIVEIRQNWPDRIIIFKFRLYSSSFPSFDAIFLPNFLKSYFLQQSFQPLYFPPLSKYINYGETKVV